MRRQVLLPLLLFGVLAVVAVLVPIGHGIAESRTQALALSRAASLDQIATRAAANADDGVPGTEQLQAYLERYADTYRERVVVLNDGGTVIAAVGPATLRTSERSLAVSALRSGPAPTLHTVYPWSEPEQLLARPFPLDQGRAVGAVLLGVNVESARADVAWQWAVTAAIGVLALATLLGASLWWTRWVIRPVRELDEAANALARREAPRPGRATGPDELRRLNASFQRLAVAVDETLAQQRAFVAEASHQLRNPLAGLRLRLDALGLPPATPHDDTAAPRPAVDEHTLAELHHDMDRLERIVQRMLTLALAEHRATVAESLRTQPFVDEHTDTSAQPDHTEENAPSGTDAVRDPTAAAARPQSTRPTASSTSAAVLVAEQRRRQPSALTLIAVDGAPQRLHCDRHDLDEILEILCDNALSYAGPQPRVHVRLDREGPHVRLTVWDDGPGLPVSEIHRLGTRFWRAPQHQDIPGTGLGLAIVAELVRANRGQLHLGARDDERSGLCVRIHFLAAA